MLATSYYVIRSTRKEKIAVEVQRIIIISFKLRINIVRKHSEWRTLLLLLLLLPKQHTPRQIFAHATTRTDTNQRSRRINFR